jgi:hypothetical protein
MAWAAGDLILATGGQPRPPQRRRVDAELIVVGGGLAGVCMALAAARHGVETLLVNDRPTLGGNSSSEVRVVPAGAAHFQAWCRETGIVEEILLRDRAVNPGQFFENGLTNATYDLVLLDLVEREPRLRVLLNTSVREVQVRREGRRALISAAMASQLGSEVELELHGQHFADCTGDGTVAHLAGADWAYGREDRATYGEPLAPLVADDVTSGSTLSIHARDVGRPVSFEPPSWAADYRTDGDVGVHRHYRNLGEPELGGFWWVEVGAPFHQIRDAEAIRFELLRHVLGVWGYLKNHHPERAALTNHALQWIGMVPGKRESRRILGDVVLTEHDCHADPGWPDAVGVAGWYLDLHIPGGILNKHEPGEASFLDAHYRYWTRIAPFSVPLRALYSRSFDNLWLGGRCLSASHVALGAIRVQQTLGALGHAVGIAAARALGTARTPRELAGDDQELAALRQDLLRDDVHLLDAVNEDAADLARGATATASSDAPLDLGAPVVAGRDLRVARGVVLPLVEPLLEEARVHVRNEEARPVRLTATVARLASIWDHGDGAPVAELDATVPAAWEGWLALPFATRVEAGPHRLALQSQGAVRWSLSDRQPVGVVAMTRRTSPGGPEPSHRDMAMFSDTEMTVPAYERWSQDKWAALAVELSPTQRPYGAANVVNGRAWPGPLPNLWISDPAAALPQHVELDLGRAVRLDTAILRFDTNLNVVLGSAPSLWRAPACASRFRLLARCDGRWRELRREEGNHLRHRVLRFEPVHADRFRVEVLATNQQTAPPPSAEDVRRWRGRGPREHPEVAVGARIYEVRLYDGLDVPEV